MATSTTAVITAIFGEAQLTMVRLKSRKPEVETWKFHLAFIHLSIILHLRHEIHLCVGCPFSACCTQAMAASMASAAGSQPPVPLAPVGEDIATAYTYVHV